MIIVLCVGRKLNYFHMNKPKSHCTVEMVITCVIQKILELPCNSSKIVKYSQYCIAKISKATSSTNKSCWKDENNMLNEGVVRLVFCTKQIKTL